jgi:hypothetical protein
MYALERVVFEDDLSCKTIYAYVQLGLIPHMRIESNCSIFEAPGPRVAPGAQLPAPAGEERRRQ